MEKKIFVYIIIALVIILCVGAGIYLINENKFFDNNIGENDISNLGLESAQNDFLNIVEDNIENVGGEQESGKLKSEENSSFDKEDRIGDVEENEINNKANEERNVLANDDFSIILPQGWRGSPAPGGVSAIAINVDEEINDPAAKKINFKSYFAITYDTLGDRSREEYIQYVKDNLNLLFTEINLTEEKQITVGENDAYAIEFGITQQGANFKVLMILVWGKKGDVWVLSLNTVEDKWEDYKSLFYQAADGFQIKQ